MTVARSGSAARGRAEVVPVDNTTSVVERDVLASVLPVLATAVYRMNTQAPSLRGRAGELCPSADQGNAWSLRRSFADSRAPFGDTEMFIGTPNIGAGGVVTRISLSKSRDGSRALSGTG
jgi:hypothetical protein